MFEPRTHQYSVPFKGNPDAALNLARTALVTLGFEVTVDSGNELHAKGPGMTHNKQPPLVGASFLQLQVNSSKIIAKATLDGLAMMAAFLYLFPPGLAIALAIMMYMMGQEITWVYITWVSPWLVISPLLVSSLAKKVTKAVDALVRCMAQAK